MASVRAAAILQRVAVPAAFRPPTPTTPATCNLLRLSGIASAIPGVGAHTRAPRLQQQRQRHSNTQFKRLFKDHPAQIRARYRLGHRPRKIPIPERKFPPVFEPKVVLPNGWSAPPAEGDGFVMPDYPFRVERTKNKPNGAVGFLPVYSDCRVHNTRHTTIIRKVSGNREVFTNELRAVLGLPGRGGTNDPIRIRTGGNIEVKGQWVREVKQWLGGLGF